MSGSLVIVIERAIHQSSLELLLPRIVLCLAPQSHRPLRLPWVVLVADHSAIPFEVPLVSVLFPGPLPIILPNQCLFVTEIVLSGLLVRPQMTVIPDLPVVRSSCSLLKKLFPAVVIILISLDIEPWLMVSRVESIGLAIQTSAPLVEGYSLVGSQSLTQGSVGLIRVVVLRKRSVAQDPTPLEVALDLFRAVVPEAKLFLQAFQFLEEALVRIHEASFFLDEVEGLCRAPSHLSHQKGGNDGHRTTHSRLAVHQHAPTLQALAYKVVGLVEVFVDGKGGLVQTGQYKMVEVITLGVVQVKALGSSEY